MPSTEIEQTAAVGFSKDLKSALLPATATLLHPTTGEEIRITMGFRRMTDGELTAQQANEAARIAAGRAITDEDILDALAPLFGTRDGRVEVSGIADFPGPEAGSPAERFRRYFGGDGRETAEDLEVERKILRVVYGGYLQCFFRLIPLELVAVAQAVSLHGGGEAAVSETGGD
jgi:hypothetical protein